jgi:hypothetical protein
MNRGPELIDLWDILYCSCQEGKRRNFIFCKNSKLQNRSDFGNTLPFESGDGLTFNSTNLSLYTNSESYPFDKLRVNSIIIRCATLRWPPIIPYPDSKVQREALDCPPRGPSRPPRSCSGFSRRKSKLSLFGV